MAAFDFLFRPNRTADLERRLQHIESFLSQSTGEASGVEAATAGAGNVTEVTGGDVTLPISEFDVEFDPDEGHIHDGEEGGTRIPHANLTTPGSALLDGAAHSDTTNSGVTRGDLIIGNATPAWDDLPIGAANTVLKSDATDPAWGNVAHSELTGVTANQHHNQSHVLATDSALGPDHTITGGVVGYVLRCLTATTAKLMQLLHSDLGSIGANDHHNQAHALDGADHTLSGATVGTFLVALTATTFGFRQIGRNICFFTGDSAGGVGSAGYWQNMPAALTELFGNAAQEQQADLTFCTQARLIVNVSTAGFAGSGLRAQYWTGAAWAYLDGSAGPECILTSTGLIVSSFVTLAAGAKADVKLRIVGINGDGIVDPVFGVIALEVR